MAKDILNRYIWLIDTIRRHRRITRKELDECWSRSPFAEGCSGIPRRTFYNYRQAIEDLFSVIIECDPRTYEYYIDESPAATSSMTNWLLDSSAMSRVLQESHDVADKIMLESVPSAREFLAPMIDALRNNFRVRFDYHPYSRSNPTQGVVVEPYFVRIHRQLWYVTGYNVADKKVKTYSFDRMTNLQVLTTKFLPPADLSPEDYFRDSFGVMVTQSRPREIKLKVSSRQAKYFRALPLHGSQSEMITNDYSVFTYQMRITSDLVAEILSHGPDIVVLAPVELRAMVTERLRTALQNYDSADRASSPPMIED